MSGPWEQFQKEEDGPWSQFSGAKPPEKQSAFRQIADVPLGIAKGAVQTIGALSDVFGAGSGVSTAIKGVGTYVSDLMSAQAKQDRAEIARIMKEAEDKGILEQVQAGIRAISVAPIDTLTSGFGSAIPAIVAGVGAATLGAPAGIITGAGALMGAGAGAGTIKGSIYEETKTALKELGASEQEAEQKAQLAQSYGGKNLDQILLGTIIGGVAAAGPLEKGTAGMLARRILGKAAATETGEAVAKEAGEAVAKGALRQRAEAGVLEALPEALQAGQEQVAQNIALQREGMDVPTFRGAVSSATLEGLAGAGLGAAVGRAPQVATLPPAVEQPVAEAPVAPAAPVPPEAQVQPRVDDITGVSREVPPSAEEAAETFARMSRMADEEGRAYAERVAQARLLRQQKEIDEEAARIAELNRQQGIVSPETPASPVVERPSIAEAAPALTPREELLAKQAEVDQLRLEAGLPTGAASLTPGVEPTTPEVEPPKLVPTIVDNRPLTSKAATNRLLVMRNMLGNQGGDPNSLAIVPHPTIENKFAIQSLDVPVKFTKELPKTAITKQITPTIVDPINAYVEVQRRTNTPAARRFVSDFESGNITREDVQTALEQERKAGQPQPLTYTSTGAPGIISAGVSKPRGEGGREVPRFEQEPPLPPAPPTEAPPVAAPPAATTQPQTLQEFEGRMPIVSDKTEVRAANNIGNFGQLTAALQLSKNPAIRRIGELGAGIASKITLRKPGRIAGHPNAAGVYRYADDSIQMIPSYAGDEHTNAHETLHALISKAQRNPTDRQKPVVAEIKKLYAYVQQELNRKGMGDFYGLTNEREFTAEAMTNPRFQYELMQIPYPGKKSAWTKFTQLIADLLGIQNTNALTEVMNLVDRLAMQKQPRKRITDKSLVDASEQPDIRKSLVAQRSKLGLYSELENKVQAGSPKAPAASWKAYINGLKQKGVKPEEIESSGVMDWLDLQKGTVTKEDLTNYLKQGGVQVEETVLGDSIKEDEKGIFERDKVFNKYEDQIQAIYAQLDKATGSESDRLMDELQSIQNKRNAEADAVYTLPASTPPKYGQYTLPGGENYREVLLTLPSKQERDFMWEWFDPKTQESRKFATRDAALLDKPLGAVLSKVETAERNKDYKSSHWDQPNILAHIRLNDRTDADGKKVLFVEEIQSDWGQEGKKKGFVSEGKLPEGWEVVEGKVRAYPGGPIIKTRYFVVDNTKTQVGLYGDTREEAIASATQRKGFTGGIPAAPFVTKTEGWLNLALKRIMVMAAEEGYDRVAFTTGEQNAERFSLDKQLSEIAYEPTGDGLYEITATDLKGKEVISEDEVGLERIEELLGKEIAEKIARNEGEQDEGGYRDWRYLRGDDLKVEAKGMRTFYDTIVPNALKKLLPKVGGGQIENVVIPTGSAEWQKQPDGMERRVRAKTVQIGFDVTPEMQEKVATTGLPMFSKRGERTQQLQDFQQTLRAQLNKFGLTDVGLKIEAGMNDAGSYAQQLIRIADDSANPIQTLRHESIHALRELGFFTDAQWKSLSKMAEDKWIDQYLKQRNVNGNPLKAGEESRYDAYMREYKGDMEKITEEAVSDAFGDFDATKPPAGLVQAILKRLQNLFKAIRSALTNVESVDQIFGKVEKGELKAGAREADTEAKSLREKETSNFLRWFKSSKVTDDEGEPKVMYHATPEDFTEFKPGGKDATISGPAIWLSPYADKQPAAHNIGRRRGQFREGTNVMPVYVRMERPLMIDDMTMLEWARSVYGDSEFPQLISKKAVADMKEDGYDGIQFDGEALGWGDRSNETIVFDGNQIKSAIGNNGEYSLTDADIRKSLGETKAKQLKTVAWSDKRIDRLIREYGYQDGRSFGMAAFVNPNDFILATTYSKKHADDIKEEAGILDFEKIENQSQTPYLEWDIENNVIVGHEGRHRMAALAAEGVTSAPVLMFIKDRNGYKKPDKYARKNSVTLKGQSFEVGKGKPVTVTNLVPLEPKQEKTLKSEFGGEADIKFSLRAAPPAKPTMGERLRAAGQEAYQKRKPLDTGAFKGVPEDLVNGLGDVFAPKNETILDRIDGMKDNFWQRVAQGVADQYRTIKEYSEDAYMKARLSKTIDGGLEGLMFHGQVFNDGGALNIRQKTKGLLEVLKPVGKELDRYLIWVALSRDSMMPEGKRSISDDLVSRRNELIQGAIDGQPRLELYQKIQKEMNALNRSVLKVAVDAGLLNTTEGAIKDIQANEKLTDQEKAEKIAELRANPIGYERFINDLNYIPFYKVMEEGDTQNVSTASGLTSQYFSKALKGGEKPFGDLMENTLRNWSHILSASMKNQAAEATIDAAVKHNAATPNLKIGLEMRGNKVYSTQSGEMVGDGSLRPEFTKNDKGAVKVMMDGQPTYYMVTDPLLLDAISAIGYMGPQSKFLDVAKDFKNLLQFGVTISPTFKVNNLVRDSTSAMGVSELRKDPIANIKQGISLSDPKNPTYIAALAGGAIFNFGSAYEGDQSRLLKRLLKKGVDRDAILDTKQRIAKGLRDSFDKYQEWGNKSESANRLALYKQLRDAGMSHLEASFKARDLLDFSMQGSWPAFRLLTQVIPFLNARIQGLYKLGRDGISPTYRFLYNSATGKEIVESDKQKAQSFMIVTTAVGLASAALYLAFKDDEDYKKRDDWDRDNFWWIKLPGMDAALRIPKPFEIGAFGTLVERTLEQIYDSGAEGKQFTDSLSRTLSSTFAMNPIPQVIKPLYDIYANKDSFTGAPIESAGLEKLSKQERQIDTTSPLAIALGGVTSILPEAMELSPVQVDYMIKGYFGWLGGTAASISMGAVAPFKDGEYPDTRWMDKASLGLVKQLPSPQSKYVTAFYESNKEISQAFADMRHYQTIGDTEKAMEILEDKGDLIALSKMYDRVAKDMGSIRTQIRIVTNDPEMSGEAKQEAIERMKMMLGLMAQQAEELRKSRKP